MFVTYTSCHEDGWGSEGVASLIHIFGTKWECSASRLGRCVPRKRAPRYPSERRLCGPQSPSGRDGEPFVFMVIFRRLKKILEDKIFQNEQYHSFFELILRFNAIMITINCVFASVFLPRTTSCLCMIRSAIWTEMLIIYTEEKVYRFYT